MGDFLDSLTRGNCSGGEGRGGLSGVRESETVGNCGRRGLATGGGFRGGGGGGGGASWALMRLRAQGLGNLSVRGSQCLGEWGDSWAISC